MEMEKRNNFSKAQPLIEKSPPGETFIEFGAADLDKATACPQPFILGIGMDIRWKTERLKDSTDILKAW